MKVYQLQAERMALELQRRNFPDQVAVIKAGLMAAREDGIQDGIERVYQMSKKADEELVEIRRMHTLAAVSSE
jgi:enoyl-CoA hydratase/carnithine racemase